MATQVSLNDGAVASAGALAIQTNGATQAVSISTGQVATFAQNPILTSGTANGVAYLNGSKVLTTGSALSFNGNTFSVNGTSPGVGINDTTATLGVSFSFLNGGAFYSYGQIALRDTTNSQTAYAYSSGASGYHNWFQNGTEQMRLTSTGLGIGTSSPTNALSVSGNANITGNTTLGDASTDTVTVNGYMGVGGAGSASAKIVLAATQTTTGSVQYGINGAPVFGSDATSVGAVYSAQPRTSAASYTINQAIGYRAIDVVQGAGSTITSQYGVYIEDQTKGTNNYGITSLVSSGTNKWNIYASGTAANYFAGNVGIGTTSPVSRLEIKNTTDNTALTVTSSYEASLQLVNGGGSEVSVINAGGSNILSLRTNNTERARIDSSGNLLVGTTSSLPSFANGRIEVATAASSYGIVIDSTASSASGIGIRGNDSTTALSFFNAQSGATVGTVVINSSSTSYNTSSDYRLKNTITPMTGALAKVSALKPVTYKWNADGSDGEGFIAHELAEVVPQCVTGEKDAVDEDGNPKYQGIDTSFLVATLTAAIQEQQAIIQSLTARITALEGA